MLLWDARENLEKNHLKKMDQIKEKYKNKENYYIHVCVNWTNNNMDCLKNTYLIRDKKPPKMLGSMLYYIDNKKGIEKLEWALPMDVAIPDSLINPDSVNPNIIDHVKGVENSIQLS